DHIGMSSGRLVERPVHLGEPWHAVVHREGDDVEHEVGVRRLRGRRQQGVKGGDEHVDSIPGGELVTEAVGGGRGAPEPCPCPLHCRRNPSRIRPRSVLAAIREQPESIVDQRTHLAYGTSKTGVEPAAVAAGDDLNIYTDTHGALPAWRSTTAARFWYRAVEV